MPSLSNSTPEFAEQSGFDCKVCHIDGTGGKLTKAGEDFRDDLKTKGLYHPLKTFQKVVRLIIGYLHLLTAIAWFGTIFYVHILLKPAYAAKGLPKGELLPIGTKVEKPAHEKVFYFMAYMNLIFVFLITFIVALWRWW